MSDSLYPVESFREAAPLLRRPFTTEATKFKVQATWPREHPTNGLVVCYIDARLVVERLNLIIPHLWSDHYAPVSTNRMWCHLTVDGITRSDVGDGEGKGLVSDALKRAAVKFGVGVSLYATPKMVVTTDGDQAWVKKDKLELRPKGEAYCRNLYAEWLKTHAAKSYGEPLDHGDVLDAVGDPDDAEPITDTTEPRRGEIPPLDSPEHDPAPAGDRGLAQREVDTLLDAIKTAAKGQEWLRATLGAAGAAVPLDGPITVSVLRSLTGEQAAKVLKACGAAADAEVAA